MQNVCIFECNSIPYKWRAAWSPMCWMPVGLVRVSQNVRHAVSRRLCGPGIALRWSQALWISPQWDLHAQLSKYVRFDIQIAGEERDWLRFTEIVLDYLRYNHNNFDSWACRSHCGAVHNAWNHLKAMLGRHTAAHHEPDILTKPDQTHLHSTYWASRSTPLVKNGIACKNTYILHRLSSCWFFP